MKKSVRYDDPSNNFKELFKEIETNNALDSETLTSSFYTLNYKPSLMAVAMFGLFNSLNVYLISLRFWPATLSGLIALLQSTVMLEWFYLHGIKLTRKERIFFDEKNILETSKQLDYNLPPIVNDLTPGNLPGKKYFNFISNLL
ncbi:unnamed protein product [Thelazia callipaeda]|uniref:ER membrane protein complex subunit 6 n=1 Tax=Thelazia callipaeda TaxID=103827 RepID=A0A0N5CUF6_THECL|nr:unnamed protein product [Thelazia callipaeda]